LAAATCNKELYSGSGFGKKAKARGYGDVCELRHVPNLCAIASPPVAFAECLYLAVLLFASTAEKAAVLTELRLRMRITI